VGIIGCWLTRELDTEQIRSVDIDTCDTKCKIVVVVPFDIRFILAIEICHSGLRVLMRGNRKKKRQQGQCFGIFELQTKLKLLTNRQERLSPPV
jgi:hypothetical protein